MQTMFELVHKLPTNMAFKWQRQVKGLVFKYDDKLDDTFRDTYAVVLWRNPEPTPYNCIDIDHILNPDMLTNPNIYGLVPVSVYEQKGYEDTEVIRTFYGRVLATGRDTHILRSLAESEWCRQREMGVLNQQLPTHDEFEGHVCTFLQNLPKYR